MSARTPGPERAVRVANCAGWLWGRFSGLRDALAGPVDVVTGDYLAEPTLRQLALERAKDPSLGYARSFLAQFTDAVGLPGLLRAGVAVRRLLVTLLGVLALGGCATVPVPLPPLPTTTAAAPAPLPAARAAAPPASSTPASPGPAPVVVLDPGHNGGNARAAAQSAREVPDGRGGTKPCNTTGTQTPDGYTEHAFTFDVAARVTRLLTARGVEVRSTRPDDQGVGPCVDRRAAIANDAGAALTVSIHADSAPASGRGFHVATSSPALAPSQGAPSQTLARDLVASLTAGGFVPSTYRGDGGLDPRADLAGLNLARIPAALVECANMANPSEAALLADPDGRQRYADALAAGILRALGR